MKEGMLTNMKGLGVFVLLVLASLSEGKPLKRIKRTIMKDYFNPLTYPTDKLKFEKGEDGKYHVQELADPVNSKVEYAIPHGIDANNEIFGDALKSSEKKADDSAIAYKETASINPESFDVSKHEPQKENIDFSTKIQVAEKDKIEINKADPEKVIFRESTAKQDSETKSEDVGSKKHEISAKLDIPVDSKWTLVPKPDGKDDKPYEGGEEYLPEPPISPEEKDDERKVEIGQIPKHHPVFVPPTIPLLIPKKFSFRVLSLLPKPPAFHISDRLPLPQPEVVEESSETAVVQNISPKGPMVIKEGRRFLANHYMHPLRIGLQLPFLSVSKVLKEAAEEEKLKGSAKSEIVDIGGRKMLLQRKVLMSPHHDPSDMHISVMSIQPLEDVDPEILKELDMENKEFESEEASLEKELKQDEKKEDEKRSLKNDGMDTVVSESGEKRIDVFSKHLPQPETLDIEKTKANEERVVNDEMAPQPGIFTPVIPAVFMVPEDPKKDEKVDDTTGEFELETKFKEEGIEKAKESHTTKEFGLKTDMQTESKLDENTEKNKGKEIISIRPEEKREEEKSTDVAKEEKDVLIGTEDLLKFRSQMESQDIPSIDSLKKITVDLMKEELIVEKESQPKDEEVAQSKIIEVTLKPEEGPKQSIATEMKKGDEMLKPEIASSHSGVESSAKEDAETDILKTDKVMTEGKKDDEVKISMGEAAASHTATEIIMKEDSKDKTDIMKIESRDLHEESKTEGKKGDAATEISVRKDEEEKKDIIHVQHSEENNPRIEDFGLTKTEGAILEERKKKFDERKDIAPSKKKKCKCEDSDDSDESNSDDENDSD